MRARGRGPKLRPMPYKLIWNRALDLVALLSCALVWLQLLTWVLLLLLAGLESLKPLLLRLLPLLPGFQL